MNFNKLSTLDFGYRKSNKSLLEKIKDSVERSNRNVPTYDEQSGFSKGELCVAIVKDSEKFVRANGPLFSKNLTNIIWDPATKALVINILWYTDDLHQPGFLSDTYVLDEPFQISDYKLYSNVNRSVSRTEVLPSVEMSYYSGNTPDSERKVILSGHSLIYRGVLWCTTRDFKHVMVFHPAKVFPSTEESFYEKIYKDVSLCKVFLPSQCI